MFAKHLILPLSALAFSSLSLMASAADLPLRLLGEQAPVAGASRVIVVNPDTTYIRVTGGETVEFVVGKAKFAWTFDGPQGPFDLQQILPAGAPKRTVQGFVEPNPLYTGS